uniref:Eco57I restriction-modification methylase domain-containing protein n=1 Tax=Halostella pelagica TaxID=2583824 RepID=UPI001F006E54|nr:TaqI-like C-terminal specificity domain-containing protein [Halostella pelagica]
MLTDGKKWRLYYGPTSHRLDSYYEIDLPTVLEQGDLEDFKYFYLFFRHGAFLEDASGDCFLDDVYGESNVFAQELGADLQDNIYEAIKVLSEGFLQYSDNDLDEETLVEELELLDDPADFEQARLSLIHDSSLIYLYRLIFVLYAEAEGRELLDTSNEIYEESYSLNSLKQDIADELDSPDPSYRDWQDEIWSRLDELFKLIDQGSKSRGIPEEDLYIPAYNGGLFRTDPDEDDGPEPRFLAQYEVGDAYLARVIELLTRSQNGNDGGKIFVDYSSLDVRHLGSIYEGLLEYKLNVADEPLALDDGEYVSADEGDTVVVDEGEVHLTTGSGERKATGSYYTPEYVVEYIVENTLEPLVDDIRADLAGRSARGDRGFAEEFAERVFDLKILDPAMGSGHFLTSAVDYLAREIIDAQEKQAAQQGIETVDEDHDINWARRQVAQRCIYGVDLNPLAVELAKVSLWLRTLAAEQPLAFLDHHLKTGNSLVGSDLEEIDALESEKREDRPESESSLSEYIDTKQGTIEQLMRIYQDFIVIENQELADVKEMEARYDEFEQNKLRQRLEAMTNVHTAEELELDTLPSDAYEQMAAALETDDSWEEIENMQWFRDAQMWASDDEYFHWKLEYPEVFYNEDGTRVDNSGFDVIIGNPPYIRPHNLDDQLKSALWNLYGESYKAKSDILNCFLQFSIENTKEGGNVGMITSDTWRILSSAKSLREFILSSCKIRSFGLLPENVFEDASVETVIVLLSPDATETSRKENTITISDTISNDDRYELPQSDYYGDDSVFFILSEVEYDVREKIESKSTNLGAVAEVDFGLKTADDSRYLKKESTKPEDEKLITSENVSRYLLTWGGDYVWYVPDDMKENKSTARPGEAERFERKKIIVSRMSERPSAVVDDDSTYIKDALLVHLTVDNISHEYVCALINSNLMTFYYNEVYTTVDLHRNELLKFPIKDISNPSSLESRPTIDSFQSPGDGEERRSFVDILQEKAEDRQEWESMAHNALTELVTQITKTREKLAELNLDVLDYFGNYESGCTLGEVGFYQPIADSDSMHHATTDSDRVDGKLQIDHVEVERDDTTVTVSATIRYKPVNEKEHDIDSNGYTQTDPIPAFQITEISDEEMALIEALVPTVVEKADGFAGFRNNATKTISPIDRLEGIELPKVDDVEAGLERYGETKCRANKLEKEIERADDCINQLIYELYELTNEEIEVVESALADD